jgi:ribonuclease BN (tRNA processing enzyme)
MADRTLRLTVVGSAAAWTRKAGHPSSCYLLELDGRGLILDLGQGSFAALAARRDPEKLRAVLISHLHSDHGIDLIPFRHYLRFACDPPGSVELHAPDDLRRRYDVLMGERDFLAELPGDSLKPGTLNLAPFEVRVGPITHVDPSFGFRVAPLGRSDSVGLVYSGDCGHADDLLPLLRPGDTLLSEAYFGAESPVAEAMHLTAAEAGRVAREAKVGRLVLTHLMDGTDEQAALDAARAAYDGPVQLAGDGLELTID